jgi:hypothetical protein
MVLQAVCSVLEFLTTKALDKKGFAWQKPMYREEVRPPAWPL